MADINHAHANPNQPVESDGVNYRGIGWFIVILTITTLACQALVWGLFEFMEYRGNRADQAEYARAPLAAPAGQRPPGPNLLTDEPANLRTFREAEDHKLGSYGWANQATMTARVPVDRAKEIVLARGLPTRSAPASPAPAAVPAPAK